MDRKSFTISVPRKWVRTALIVGVTALVVAPLSAVASHTFTDVPDSHTFHNDIAWLEASGVTRGCNPPTNSDFCPDDNVTRGQMAAFMKRFANYINAEDGTPAQADNANTLDGQTATAYEIRVAADGCKVETPTSTSCGDGTIPDQTTVELARVSIDAPSNGTIVVSGYTFGNSSNWFSVDEGCAPYVLPEITEVLAQGLNGTFFGGSDEIFGSATTATNVSSGDHTIRLCSAYEDSDDAGAVFSANLTTVWSAGGNVSISADASTASTPLGSGGSLLGN